MKILHVGKYYPPYKGGMETVLQNLVEGLLDLQWQVSVIVAGTSSTEQVESVVGPLTGNEGRLLRIARYGEFNSQPITPDLFLAVKSEIDRFRPDIVHLHLPNPLAAAVWLAVKLAFGDNCPRLAVWYHADITRQKLGAKLVNPLIKQCLRSAAGICTSSTQLAAGSTVLQDFRAKTSVIPFGLADEPWGSVNPTGDGPFLFIGRLVHYKGILVLLDALAEVPTAKLAIIGQGPLESVIQQKINDLGLYERVEVFGEVDEPELLVQLSRAKSVVLPSLDASETFGLVQLEAMASGVPVVVSDLDSGVCSVGQNELTGLLVKPGDINSLAQALGRLQNDSALVQQLGRQGREMFKQKYSRDLMIERLSKWYLSLELE